MRRSYRSYGAHDYGDDDTPETPKEFQWERESDSWSPWVLRRWDSQAWQDTGYRVGHIMPQGPIFLQEPGAEKKTGAFRNTFQAMAEAEKRARQGR